MPDSLFSRRHFVKATGSALGLLPLSALPATALKDQVADQKIVCVGCHPDDPESGCGGTLAKFANAGNPVTIIFQPTDITDISGTREQKKKALYCDTSQDPPGIYACGHASMEDFREDSPV